MKKKITALLLVVALVAVSIAGATMAYFTDTDQAVNVATVGNVKIEQIEQERDANGNLQPFTQNKPLYPYVGEIAWNDNKININGHDYNMFGDKLKNALDKIITVKNTGKSDAYVRTWIALEDPFPTSMIGVNVGGVGYTQTPWAAMEINGVQYSVSCFTYTEALKSGESSLPSLLQVYLKSIATNEDAALLGDTYEILAFSQAVQTAGFANAEEALEEAFGKDHPWTAATQGNAGNNTELKAALTSDATTIIVNLTEDATYDVSSWNTFAMGGDKTELIVINGNGHTLTFNLCDSDWSHVTTNGAKLVLNNVTIKSAGYNSGHWKRNGVAFACEVEMNNVTTCPIILENNAQLNDVTINGGAGVYGLWIAARDITVNANGLEINSERGIKIADEDAAPIAKTTLNVNNAKFNTTKKAAILVTSTAGATINLENVDITGVAADPIHAVWVDEDRATYADLVTVSGGLKAVEGEQGKSIASDDVAEIDAALMGDTNVALTKDLTVDASSTNANSGYGATGLKVDGTIFDGNGNTLTVNKAWSTWDCAITITSGTIKDLTINSGMRGIFMGGANGDVFIDNVVIDGTVYTFNSDGGNKNYGVYISNSTLNGWTSHSDVHKEVVYTNCNFGEGQGYAFCRPYGKTVLENCVFEEGFRFDTAETSDITFINCYYGDTLITAENAATLGDGTTTFFYNGLNGITIK